MTSDLTRASLLSRVRDPADQAAWREFEARYGDLIVRYARARGLQHADAEDVRQHVLMDLSKSLRSFAYDPARGRFRDYLGRVVRNVVNSTRARPNPPRPPQGTIEDAVDASLPPATDAGADALWEQQWVDHHYRRALRVVHDTFEPRSVAIFERILAGDAVEAVAAAFEMSAQAVHKIKQRIRDRLMQLVAEQIREEDQPDAARIEHHG